VRVVENNEPKANMRIERASSSSAERVASSVEAQHNGWEFKVVAWKRPDAVKFNGAWEVVVLPPEERGKFPIRRQSESWVSNGLSRLVFAGIRAALVELGCPVWLAEHLEYCSRDTLHDAVLEKVMAEQAAALEAAKGGE